MIRGAVVDITLGRLFFNEPTDLALGWEVLSVKLSRRIRDLVRAGLRSPQSISSRRKFRSPRQVEAQLDQINQALTRAAGRDKRLQDALSLAEQEGRERDAIRLRREMADLDRSRDELQAALDLIEAHIEMTHMQKSSETVPQATREADVSLASPAETKEESDITERKVRLSAPKEVKQGPRDTELG
jgi:hypothetical protein